MKHIKIFIAVILLGSNLQLAHAQASIPASTDSNTAASLSNDVSEGEVIKIDKSTNKITLKHGPIKNLDMPGMTMIFRSKDVAMLDKLATSDKVRFRAEKINGAIYVTDIQVVKQ
ncbi:copper-binding protein [Undibacterium sp. Ji83W]|uniref:copper-binding protein n=1 Tax=Undibacterium sp. Ji83W TaxID=3413043 RepID=UPI003BF15A97